MHLSCEFKLTSSNGAAQAQQRLPAVAAAAAVFARAAARCGGGSTACSSYCGCRCLPSGSRGTARHRTEVHGPVPAVLHQLRPAAVHMTLPGRQPQGAGTGGGLQRCQPPLGLQVAAAEGHRYQTAPCIKAATRSPTSPQHPASQPACSTHIPSGLQYPSPPRAWHPGRIRRAPAAPQAQSGAAPLGCSWRRLYTASGPRRCMPGEQHALRVSEGARASLPCGFGNSTGAAPAPVSTLCDIPPDQRDAGAAPPRLGNTHQLAHTLLARDIVGGYLRSGMWNGKGCAPIGNCNPAPPAASPASQHPPLTHHQILLSHAHRPPTQAGVPHLWGAGVAARVE